MKSQWVFVVAEDIETYTRDGTLEVVTQVCHNLGVWLNRGAAELVAKQMCADEEGYPEDDDVGYAHEYYVLALLINPEILSLSVKYKKTGALGRSSQFNVHACAEVLVCFEEGDMDTISIRDLDVAIGGVWVDMAQAFKDALIVPDNYNTWFGPPIDEECRLRGYNP